MNHGQQQKMGRAAKAFGGAGGSIDVDGVPMPLGSPDKLNAALSCLDASQVESLMSDMATLQMMAEANALGNQYQPEGSAGSKPKLHVKCGSGDWGVTWT